MRARDDRALASLAARGDEEAFAELYDRHAAGLLAFARQYMGERTAAEDVVQLTFLAAYRALRGGTQLHHPRAWLYQVARNTALTAARDRAPADVSGELAEELEDRASTVAQDVEQREALREVVHDIVALPPEQRAALALFELGDFSHAEIAGVLGCPPAKVKALVFQARSALVARRQARDATCTSVRQKLTSLHGGALNHRLIRHHLDRCADCTAYRDELRDRRRKVAVLLPVLPAAGLRDAVVGPFHLGAAAPAAKGTLAARLAQARHARWAAVGSATALVVVGAALAVWPHSPRNAAVRSKHHASAAPAPPAGAPHAAAAPAAATPSAPAHRTGMSAARRRQPSPRHAVRRTSRPPARTAHASVGRPQRTAARAPTPSAGRPPRRPVTNRPGRAPQPASPRPRHRQPPAGRKPSAPGGAGPAAPRPPSASPPPAPRTSPTPASSPAASPVASPPPAPGPSPGCVDHSHASEQGLAHGQGHHKCTGR